VKGIGDELARVGIRGRLARRIELELADHERCNPQANLGEPRLIAERFAEELRLPATRRAAHVGFGSLAVAAVLLGVSQRTISVAGGFPDVFGGRGSVVAFAGLAIVVAGQVAFVGGVLAVCGCGCGLGLPQACASCSGGSSSRSSRERS
jgi:hypothetical protein